MQHYSLFNWDKEEKKELQKSVFYAKKFSYKFLVGKSLNLCVMLTLFPFKFSLSSLLKPAQGKQNVLLTILSGWEQYDTLTLPLCSFISVTQRPQSAHSSSKASLKTLQFCKSQQPTDFLI